MDSFDSIVVGFGLAGLVTVRRLLGYGLRVAVISKSGREDRLKTKIFGAHRAFSQSLERTITLYAGRAYRIEKGMVLAQDSEGKQFEVRGRSIVIATGAVESLDPRFQDIEVPTFSLERALEQDLRKKRVLIVGSDLESFLLAFSLARQAHVTFLPRGEVLQGFDSEIKQFFMTHAHLIAKDNPFFRFLGSGEIRKCDGNRVVAEVEGKEQDIGAYEVIVVSGKKRANTLGVGLEELGVEMDSDGFVFTDDRTMTRCHDVYAVGDCTGFPFFASKAIEEANVCASNIASKPKKIEGFRFKFFPHRRFPFAEVGMSEDMLATLGIRYMKAICRSSNGAFVKVLGDEKTLYGMVFAGKEVMDESCVKKAMRRFKRSCDIIHLDSMLPPHHDCPLRKALASIGNG